MKLSIILRFCLWFMGISMAFPSLSQTMLVTNGNTSSRIILKENNQISWTAANLLQTFIQKVTSCKLPVVISQDRKSTRLNSSHKVQSRMPSSA